MSINFRFQRLKKKVTLLLSDNNIDLIFTAEDEKRLNEHIVKIIEIEKDESFKAGKKYALIEDTFNEEMKLNFALSQFEQIDNLSDFIDKILELQRRAMNFDKPIIKR